MSIAVVSRSFLEAVLNDLPGKTREDLNKKKGWPEIHCTTDNGHNNERVLVAVTCHPAHDLFEIQIVENAAQIYPGTGGGERNVTLQLELFPSEVLCSK